ncbi:peptidase C14 caspase catalytic subunit p20 [Calothrix sp. NIES-4071]|nr:peptidase C14 caspase catalytic subunit p20 [Calothrix sp. NIES-4071]BAZ55807.1 peptidase C14 caspase catalytic subunit p20 [Calothrix sp. NIES-4105]
MINWTPYLESICDKYAQWWETYTLTDVVGEKHDAKAGKFSLLDFRIVTFEPEKEKPEEKNEKKEELNVLEGLRRYAAEHVLLIGRPGSGKSTALERLLLEMAENPLLNEKIPVLVELRYYRTSILDLIKEFLLRHHPNLSIEREKIESLLRQRQFLLLFDGVNELPSEDARQDLHKFRKDFHETPMVFTTRDLRMGGDLEISKKLEMQPLTQTQMEDFVRGYLPEVGEQMLLQLGSRLQEFGQTPLFLWMLCSVFQSNQNNIPSSLGYIFRSFTEVYDNKIKRYVPTSDDASRDWWGRLLQHLAWVMTQGLTSPQTPLLRGEGLNDGSNYSQTEILVAISYDDAIKVLTEFLREQGYHQPLKAEEWLKDLLKHHLIQIGLENKIEFRHQLIQEYYAAERLLQQISTLSDEELQWEYLNYLKWTEPAALMVELVKDEELALRIVSLALQVDWQLGARLAGAVKSEWQEKTIGLIYSLGLPQLLEIHLLAISRSEIVTTRLIKLLQYQDFDVRRSAVNALGKIQTKRIKKYY